MNENNINPMIDSISAVVVTYNRLELLKRCIQSLRDQVKKVDQIFVINNGSTDTTVEWLEKQSDLTTVTQDNLGGAAGFYRGMKEAYESGSDWIWIMDDDAFPDKDCLYRLTSNSQLTKGKNVVLSPIVIEGNEIDRTHRGFIDFKTQKYPVIQKLSLQKLEEAEGPMPISFASFIGILIGRKAVEKIGLPDFKYFIYNDDVEYSMRLTKNNCLIYLVKDAVIFHRTKDETVKINTEFDLKNYWVSREDGTKNIVVKGQKRQRPEIFINYYIGKRNLLHTVLKHEGFNSFVIRSIIDDLKHFLVSFFLSNRNDKIRLIKLNYLYYKQGITGKFKNEKFFSLKN